jgi:hypothetical protein
MAMRRFPRATQDHASPPTTGCWCEGDFATAIAYRPQNRGLGAYRQHGWFSGSTGQSNHHTMALDDGDNEDRKPQRLKAM